MTTGNWSLPPLAITSRRTPYTTTRTATPKPLRVQPSPLNPHILGISPASHLLVPKRRVDEYGEVIEDRGQLEEGAKRRGSQREEKEAGVRDIFVPFVDSVLTFSFPTFPEGPRVGTLTSARMSRVSLRDVVHYHTHDRLALQQDGSPSMPARTYQYSNPNQASYTASP